MVLTNIPVLLSSICVSIYWLTVFIKAILITPKIGKTPNIIPKEVLGFLSRLIMMPLIACWLFLPWQALFFSTTPFPLMAWLGTLSCIVALVLSFYCWHHMGNAWRIGIDPKEKNKLIIDGPFKYIRHPIYALSMLLMLGTFLSVQTRPIFILFCTHWLLFTLEAYREEQYLSKIHGITYYEYMKQTNRFLPPLRRRMSNV